MVVFHSYVSLPEGNVSNLRLFAAAVLNMSIVFFLRCAGWRRWKNRGNLTWVDKNLASQILGKTENFAIYKCCVGKLDNAIQTQPREKQRVLKTLLVGGLEHFLFSHILGNVIIPTDKLHHFSEGGRYTTNQLCYVSWHRCAILLGKLWSDLIGTQILDEFRCHPNFETSNLYPLVMTNIAIENGPVEIVDFPIDSMVDLSIVM